MNDHIMLLEVDDDSVFESEHIIRIYDHVNSVRAGRTFKVLLDLKKGTLLGDQVHHTAADPKYLDYTDAIAIVVRNLAHRIIGNFYLKLRPTHIPTQLFREREAAIEWLRQLD